ncbi:MAG TPA: exodeoxyribonuclease VII small subunit [Myxococcales bacterium]|nr:exodeoxyribonuclease VII small subunit [Myxococcales bacterium]HAN30130.1 exodeoxyribonuclease VII small subunit [Myxococcales bacterium]
MTQSTEQDEQPNVTSEGQPNFEGLMDELETIVHRLEQGDLPLTEGIAAFERGVHVSNQAKAILDAAEARVDQLSSSGSEPTEVLSETRS